MSHYVSVTKAWHVTCRRYIFEHCGKGLCMCPMYRFPCSADTSRIGGRRRCSQCAESKETTKQPYTSSSLRKFEAAVLLHEEVVAAHRYTLTSCRPCPLHRRSLRYIYSSSNVVSALHLNLRSFSLIPW